MRRDVVLVTVGVLLLPCSSHAAERQVKEMPETRCLKVTFNGETINAFYVIIDARTPKEKETAGKHGQPGGAVLVFFQGHGQHPADAYKFTAKLARMSRSGIVIVPVCDTPYGKDEDWRGDRGKDVVLMAIVRHVLQKEGIVIDGYKPLTDMTVAIEGEEITPQMSDVKAKLAAIGWSHGAILARRCAHYYPEAVVGLGHVCPAGYKQWAGSVHLAGRFAWEGLHIGTLLFRGNAGDTLSCGWGLTKGMVGDFCRSIPDGIGALQPLKFGRSCRDVRECTLYCDDSNLPLPGIGNIVVIFGLDDTCMYPRDYGIKNPENPTQEEGEVFWMKYYPGAIADGARRTFKVLPGTHIGPVSHREMYAREVLVGLDQMVAQAAYQDEVKPLKKLE